MYYVAPSHARAMRRLPRAKIKRRNNPTMPTQPGRYYWSEWKAEVDVYRKRSRAKLYVTPPGGVEIEVTPNIAGTFRRIEQIEVPA